MQLNFFTFLLISFPFLLILLSYPQLALSHENAKTGPSPISAPKAPCSPKIETSPIPKSPPASAPKSSSFAPKSSPSIGINDDHQPDHPIENDSFFTLSALLGSTTLSKLPLMSKSRFEFLRPNVKKICEATDDVSLCTTTILPFLKGNVNPAIALRIEIRVALEFIIGTHKKFMSIASDHKFQLSSIATRCLQTCARNYDSAIDDLKKSLEALTQHDVRSLKTNLSAVITHLGTCHDAFNEEGIELPLAKILAFKTRMLAGNCMAISSLID